jgi:hypothetical protein
MDRASHEGRYIMLDPADVFAEQIVDGWPDEARVWKSGISLFLRAGRASAAEPPRVAAFGECSATLLRDGYPDAAVELEHLWNELTIMFGADVLCVYSASRVPQGGNNDVFQRICREHTAVQSR